MKLHRMAGNPSSDPFSASLAEPRAKMFAGLFSRAVAFHQAGNLDGAEATYRTLLTFNPRHADVLNLLGAVHIQRGQWQQGLLLTEQAIAINPAIAQAHNNRACALQHLTRYEEALQSVCRALALAPDYPDALINRSNLLYHLRRYAEAAASYDQALERIPGSAEVYNNRGSTLLYLHRYEEAMQNYRDAIALDPAYACAYNSLGFAHYCLGEWEQATACYDKAIALDAGFADAWWNKAILRLTLGDYAEGWRLYEWRWKKPQNPPRKWTQPFWSGAESLEGKTLLLPAEQGLGDAIQFCRYIPQMKARGADVILEAQPQLLPLLAMLAGAPRLVALGERLPEHDFYCPLASLPLALGTTLETIPAPIPYLHAEETRRARWVKELGKKSRPRIGVVYCGAPGHMNDHNRSIALGLLEPLWHEHLEYHLLQKDIKPQDEAMLARTPLIRHDKTLRDFADTAALAAEMDVIVSVDTSVAHLAGALGRPVWILLPFTPDFRWLLERQDSPWYPTARLFRQRAIGDWEGVVATVVNALKARYA